MFTLHTFAQDKFDLLRLKLQVQLIIHTYINYLGKIYRLELECVKKIKRQLSIPWTINPKQEKGHVQIPLGSCQLLS